MKHSRQSLKNKVIDCHNHVGVCIKAYARLEYPYAETLESLYHKQLAAGVDLSIVFPFTSDLHFNIKKLAATGVNTTESSPISSAPYKIENELVMHEVFRFNPELAHRFIPFVSVDTERKVSAQIKALESLEQTYPVYGIKINPTVAQSRTAALLTKGRAFLDYAAERNMPLLFHTSPLADDHYSYAGDAFKVMEKRPDIRFALAHALVFHRGFLETAAAMPNVWIDTAAFKIQVDVFNAMKLSKTYKPIDADFSDYKKVMQALTALYPDKIIWGSDSPAYSYICRRWQGNTFVDFNYKGGFIAEKDALDALPKRLKTKISNANTLDWLFGK